MAVGVAAALAAPPAWLQATLLLPLALLLPGYAIGAALFPPGTLSPGARAVQTFAFGVAAAGLGGLVLQIFVGLDRTAWVALLVGLTLAATAVAQRRRARGRWGASRRRPRFSRLAPASALALAVAAAVGGAAIGVAAQGAREQQSRQAFVSLWAVPAGDAAPGSLRIGVWNHGVRGRLRIEVGSEGKVLARLPVRLDAAGDWEATVSLTLAADAESVLVTLLRNNLAFRSVELKQGALP
ncbi:MAG: hypothetical protein ACM3NV_00675 [Syntrophothermus sp.]